MKNNPKTPLEGIRMLDLGRYQAGPRCGLMFARMGAEVIKIESLNGDESRKNGPNVRGQSAYWVQYNSGKKSLAINLRTDKGKEVLKDLVKVSEIMHGENELPLVNENDLADYIQKGHISGAAFDVFSLEPAKDNPLFGFKEVVVTPHLGAATEEAQKNVSIQVAEQMSQYLTTGAISNALNIPSVSAEDAPKLKPYMKLAEQIGKLAGQITETSIKKIKIEFVGQVAQLNTKPLSSVLVAGLLAPSMEAVNMVNAPIIAKNRNMILTTVSYTHLTLPTNREV